jgi:hypothetical protein
MEGSETEGIWLSLAAVSTYFGKNVLSLFARIAV